MRFEAVDRGTSIDLIQIDDKLQHRVLLSCSIRGDNRTSPERIMAALVHAAGALLVAEYENQHSLLNDAARATNQAVAFAKGFKEMTGMGGPPGAGQGSPADYLGSEPCPKCGHMMLKGGQSCLNCELEADTDKLVGQ